MSKGFSIILVGLAVFLIEIFAEAQTIDSFKSIELHGYIVEVYFRIPNSSLNNLEGSEFIFNHEFNKRKISLSNLGRIFASRDTLIALSEDEPFITMNQRYFDGKLSQVRYDTSKVEIYKHARFKKTKIYIFRYYPVIAKCSWFVMPKRKVAHLVTIENHNFMSKEEVEVILINEIIVK